jgi:hypothetical protein
MLGFLLGFSKHSSVVMHVPVGIQPFVSKTTVTEIQKLSAVDKYMTFSIHMNASTLKNHFVQKPRDPLNLDYLKCMDERVK